MTVVLIAMALVAAAELGDKTQLVALVLARRLGRPGAVAAALVVAMTGMHSIAAFGGAWLNRTLPEALMEWILAIGFLAMAAWMAFSRGHRPEEVRDNLRFRSAFLASLGAFVALEFGDKSQLVTVGLSIKFEPTWMVALGAVLGSIMVNLPVIWLGWKFENRIPHRLFHWVATVLFALIGLWMLVFGILDAGK